MFRDKKVVVVMPAFNAETTLLKTYEEVVEQEFVDEVVIVDDFSTDKTVEVARSLPKATLVLHGSNRGYGANQKTCYQSALKEDADIVVMVHPDYQYSPKLIPAMVSLIGNNVYDCVLGSRILGGQAVKKGMPLWRYVSNRVITLFENLLMGAKLSEYHTGYRAFSRNLLESIDLSDNSDDFLFDNQMLAQILWFDFSIAEISCPARYESDSSSINFVRSVVYGFGCLWTAIQFRMAKSGIHVSRIFRQLND